MDTPEIKLPVSVAEHDQTEKSYFGNPYQLGYEQYGLEFLDRNTGNTDSIERVVILGYN